MALTTTPRGYESQVTIEPCSGNGLAATSAAQCQHIRAAATNRVDASLGNVGPLALSQIRDTLAVLRDQ